MGFMRRAWNWEIEPEWASKQRWVPAWAVLTMVIYVVMEVVVLAPATVVGLTDYLALKEKGFHDPGSYDFTARIFPYAFWILVGANLGFRIFIGIEGYFVHVRKGLDRGEFFRNLILYNPAAVFTLGLHMVIAAMVGAVLWLTGMGFNEGFEFVAGAGANLRIWISDHIPTLISLPEKWMAGLCVVTLYSFIAYFEHWISHKNRFLWHVVHAPHHLPDMLHPLGAPLAFSFDVFFIPIRVVLGVLLTKLVYAQPMVLEGALLALANYCFEIFNHSTAHYEIAARSKMLRFISKLGGGHGAYHYLHHSSAERHQMVNFGPGIWMIWDRLFGTFEEPPLERPSVGWTGNPRIWHNPLRVMFGGPARILYELRHNSVWLWPRILFGSVYWNPPRTIDYIKAEVTEMPILQHVDGNL